MTSEPFLSKKSEKEKLIEKYTHTGDVLNSGFFNKLFFYWAFKTIKLANITPLKSEHLGKLEGKNRSEVFLEEFLYFWDVKNYKSIKSLKLFKTAFRTNVWRIILIIFLSSISLSLDTLQVILLREYIKLYEVTEREYSPTLIGIIFIVSRILNSLIYQQCSLVQSYVGYKTSLELNCVIYNKVLKEHPASFKQKSNNGEIINLMQIDSQKISNMMTTTPRIFIIPFQITSIIYLLFKFFGISFIFGLITMILFIIINFFMQRKFRLNQKEMLKKKDARMKVTSEMINSIKILKMYSWEDEYLQRIRDTRDSELSTLRRIFNIQTLNSFIMWCAPICVSTVGIGAYQYNETYLKLSDILSALTLFNMLQDPLRSLPYIFNTFNETLISLERIEKYLNQDEINYNLLERNDFNSISKNIAIKIENGFFSWGSQPINETNDKIKILETTAQDKISLKSVRLSLTSSDIKTVDSHPFVSDFKIQLSDINLTIKTGEFIAVIGEVGSGKSSLVQAILNNMQIINNNLEHPTRLILNGTVAYVSQTPWIQNNTLRNNILFNKELIEYKYNNVLTLCELKEDLKALVGGDLTEIGEKGVNLSGGQKARVAIARAVYNDSDIYILDDPISALDAYVAKNIMKNVLVSHLKNKTRILVTHAIQYLNYCDRIILMEKGMIRWEGNYQELIKQGFYNDFMLNKLKEEVLHDHQIQKIDNNDQIEIDNIITLKRGKSQEIKNDNVLESIPTKNKVSRITRDEDKEVGSVQMKVYRKYIEYTGGFIIFGGVFIVMFMWQGLKGFSDIWLTIWTKKQDPDHNMTFFFIYAALGICSAVFILIRVYLITRNSLICSRKLHEDMITRIINAPITLYHDTVPKGQILNRLSKDLGSIDSFLANQYGNFFVFFFSMVGAIIVCSIFFPYCLIAIPIVFIFGFMSLRFYINASRDISRLDGITRSPILNTLGETVSGAITIRSFQYEKQFINLFCQRENEFFKIRIFSNGVSNWFSFSLDIFSLLFFAFLIIVSIILENFFDEQSIGIVLSYSLSLEEYLLRLLSNMSNLENSMVALERCLKFTEIIQEKEKELPEDKKLSKNWPEEGTIQFVNYSVKYRPETNLVLKNINLYVQGGEKIGIVGRTGSGKSTMCLSIFRIIEPATGTIYIDDVDITKLGLKCLRKTITIIPQDPILMERSLRYNIDPLQQFTDDEIKKAINLIGFGYIIENNSKGLDMIITQNGNNLSVGEKQLVCITRALLRKSKIILMDEATANIDLKTENIIQTAITEFLNKSTVFTIAHRIKTIINYDKILVLNDGEIAEFDTPNNLLERKDSLFYSLYSKSS